MGMVDGRILVRSIQWCWPFWSMTCIATTESPKSPGMLPSSRFGGPRATKLMIHTTWHLTTIAFLTVGLALLLSGSVRHGDTARGIGLVGAGASTGFAALAVGLAAAYTRSVLVL